MRQLVLTNHSLHPKQEHNHLCEETYMNPTGQQISVYPNTQSLARPKQYQLQNELDASLRAIEEHEAHIHRMKQDIADAREEIKVYNRQLKRQQERLASFHEASAKTLREK
jgi:peptidoglycan hydrolase CwlO-like protein